VIGTYEEQQSESTMPADLGAEKTVLGAILVRNETIAEVSSMIDTGDFYLADHRHIYQAMQEIILENRPIDVITILDSLKRSGGSPVSPAYVESLNIFAPVGKVNAYCSIVREKARLRTIIEQCHTTAGRALDGSHKALELAGELQEVALTVQAHGSDNLLPIVSTMNATMQEVERRRQLTNDILGLPLGIRTVDKAIGGVQEGELCIIAARPGRGKTHLLIQAAITNAQRGVPVVIFSIEMKRHAMQKRLAGHHGRIPMWMLRDERLLSAEMHERFQKAMAEVAQLPIFIEDSSGITTRELTARAALAVKRYKAGLVEVDYAQLITAAGKDDVEREAKKSRALTRIAKDYAPVIAAAQLSRAPGHDLNKLPNFQDLKGSSQYEQDAHIIGLIHRPVNEQNTPTGEDVLIIDKHREGEAGREPIKMTEWGDFVPRATVGGAR
jgi:replicative DNA helicase